MKARAEEAGVTLGDYAAWAVRTYADAASPDEWMTLIGALGRSHDSGADCLRRAFTWVVANESPVAG